MGAGALQGKRYSSGSGRGRGRRFVTVRDSKKRGAALPRLLTHVGKRCGALGAPELRRESPA